MWKATVITYLDAIIVMNEKSMNNCPIDSDIDIILVYYKELIDFENKV